MNDPYTQSLFVVPSKRSTRRSWRKANSSRLKQLEKSKCTCSGKTTKGVLITFPIDTGSPCLSVNCIRVK